jgi:ComF family protein
MRGNAARLVREFKYAGWTALAVPMGRALSDPAQSLARRAGVPADEALLVPVPITPARRRERGFNQARLLADALSDVLGARLMEILERRTARRSQVHLRRRDRLANAPGSFRTSVHVRQGEHERRRSVLLVDDVVTTGATAAACATTLAAAGWQPIGLVSFARAWRTFEPSGDSPPPM